ncbi:hypothetical protein IFM89_036262 [Coptis chinensis]|uniref:Protein TIC 21, chloroplastic n=1 Tax=Coptis chinensis TaxID=261450 RepID=A0A835LU63_9MAGN|nr:hypothetical protein IFM89_036262 [Coptis chinensis]
MQSLLLHSTTKPFPLSFSSSSSSHSSFPSKLPLLSSISFLKTPLPLPLKTATPFATSPSTFISPNDDSEKAKLAQVAKRLENTSRYFKRLGSLGFWGQLVCTVVSAVILSFSIVITGKITSPVTFYSTAAGIVAAFISVFWSFGYIRLSDRLRRTANDPAKAKKKYGGYFGVFVSLLEKERVGMFIDLLMVSFLKNMNFNYMMGDHWLLLAEVVKSLKNGIVVNILGMGAAVLGMQATVGLLVAKALTSSANPYYQGVTPGSSPVLALDVFLVQASANTILSHFLGLVFSLELLRSVTLPPSEGVPVPRVA